LGYRSHEIAAALGISERTLRRWIARAREEVAADYVIRDGGGLVGNRAEVDGLLRANLREIERLRERELSVRESLALLRERRAVAEALSRLTGANEMMG
jgi:DNA-binding transcriptional regulator LsrR (DeoR family)